MGLYVLTNTVLVGFFAFAALHYFWYWWLSRRESVFLSFGLYSAVCSLICTQLVLVATTDSVDACHHAMTRRASFSLLIQPLILAVYSAVTGVRSRTFQVAVTGVCLLAVAVNHLFMPVAGTVVGLTRMSLPWGEEITFPVRDTPGRWIGPIHGLILSVYTFGLAGAVRLWRRDHLAGFLVGSAAACSILFQIPSLLMDVFGISIRIPFVGVLPHAIFVVFLSITLSRTYARRGREVTASEHRFRSLVEQATDGIVICDSRGRYLDANPAACRMFGYERDEFLTLSIPDLLVPEDVPRLAPEIARLGDGRPINSEWQFRRRDGSRFWGEVNARQLPDGRLLGFVRDISERKRAVERLAANEVRYRTPSLCTWRGRP